MKAAAKSSPNPANSALRGKNIRSKGKPSNQTTARARGKVASQVEKKGPLADFVSPKYRPLRWLDRKPESFVGKVRLLTEKHPEWIGLNQETLKNVIPDIRGWRFLRKQHHLQFSTSDVIEYLRRKIENYALKPPRTIKDLKAALNTTIGYFEAHPRLESGWRGLLTLALEVVDNAIWCWKQKVNGAVLSDLVGFARRFVATPEKPEAWNGERFQVSPLWLVRMENGFEFIAPDWFWLTAPLALNNNGRTQKAFLRPVKHILSEYLIDLFDDLAKGETLENEPLIVRNFLGDSEKISPGIPVGEIVKGLLKSATQSFDDIVRLHFERGFIWFPGIEKLKRE